MDRSLAFRSLRVDFETSSSVIVKFNILTIRHIKKKKKKKRRRKANIEIDPPPPKKKDCTTQILLKCCMFSMIKPIYIHTVNGKVQ